MAQHGGKRAGAGRKPGPTAASISKQEARELLRQIAMRSIEPMVEAQVANAQGLKYMVVRDKRTGKFVRVTEAMARELEGQPEAEHQSIEIWEKDPSVQAFTDLMNRIMDRPPESEPDQPWKGELTLKWQGD